MNGSVKLCAECGTPRFKEMIELIKAPGKTSEPAGPDQ